MTQPTEPNTVEPQVGDTTPPPAAETVEGDKFDLPRAMALIEKLRGEVKELKPKAKAADDLTAAEQKRKEAEMTATQKLQAELDKAKADLKAAQLNDMRRAVAAEVGLPLVFADRLQGETPEDLKTDAEKLLAALPKAAPKPPNLGPTNPGSGASQGESDAQALARIRGQGINVFDPNFAKSHGGGVMINTKPLARTE